jgi:hypothetical protein
MLTATFLGFGLTETLLSEGEKEVYFGFDANAEARGFAGIPDTALFDHEGHTPGDAPANLGPLFDRCQKSFKRAVWEEERELSPVLYTGRLDDLQLGDRAVASDPRIVYFIGISRASGAIVVSRLLLALYHSSHLYLIHVDLKCESKVKDELSGLIANHPNIILTQTRRLVQWGAWTMVAIMLDAIKTVTHHSVDFDFFINLSDADIALRTNDEIIDFLRPYKGRQFVQVEQHAAVE